MNVIIAYSSLLTILLSADSNDSQIPLSHSKHDRQKKNGLDPVSLIIVSPLFSFQEAAQNNLRLICCWISVLLQGTWPVVLREGHMLLVPFLPDFSNLLVDQIGYLSFLSSIL